MHRVRAGAAAALTAALCVSLLGASPASADEQVVVCNPETGMCSVFAKDNGTRGRRGDHGRAGGGGPVVTDPRRSCFTKPASPQPPAGDPAWGGRDPSTGTIYVRTCPFTHAAPTPVPVFVPNGEAPPTVVTPGQLALQALESLQLPDPVVRRSPSERNADDGVPYTWVHLWTWFWTSPARWRPVSEAASAGAVSAQVTVTPQALIFEPGDGSAAVTCAGPGRPWRPADGNSAPPAGACGYRYQHVTANGPLTATLSIRWSVTWTGSGGAGGTLPAMTTSTTSTFAVQQLQAVNR